MGLDQPYIKKIPANSENAGTFSGSVEPEAQATGQAAAVEPEPQATGQAAVVEAEPQATGQAAAVEPEPQAWQIPEPEPIHTTPRSFHFQVRYLP